MKKALLIISTIVLTSLCNAQVHNVAIKDAGIVNIGSNAVDSEIIMKLGQSLKKDTVIEQPKLPADTVASITVADLFMVLNILEKNNWLAKDFNRVNDAFAILIQIRNQRIMNEFIKSKKAK